MDARSPEGVQSQLAVSGHLPGAVGRRAFLRAASGALLARYLARGSDVARGDDTTSPSLTTAAPIRVVEARVPPALSGGEVDPLGLGEAFEAAMMRLMGAGNSTDAWRQLLDPADVVGLKFNRSGQHVLGTTNAVADLLVGSLVRAGWPADQIVCIECPATVVSRWGTRPAVTGYGDIEVDFGSGRDQLASVLSQVTAIVNVPFLKTHNIAGLTCTMKNLSHGFVKHPARYHRNGCAPYVADIIAAPAIAQKVRLHVVDALRVVFDRGPDPVPDAVHDYGALLLGRDALATDLVGLSLLNGIRRGRGLEPIARSGRDVPYLAAAMDASGRAMDLGDVDLVRLSN